MKIYGGLGDLASAAATARTLESAGYDGVWTGEINSDPFLSRTLVPNATSTLELGPSIAGSQVNVHVTRRFSMTWSQPAARMRDYYSLDKLLDFMPRFHVDHGGLSRIEMAGVAGWRTVPVPVST